jgi:hypothetical protein
VLPRIAEHLSLGSDAFELHPDLRRSFTVLTMLDVLEHLEDPRAFLARCAECFPNARHAFVTVPARMELWSNYDEYYGHELRYTRETLAALAGDRLRLECSGYFFHALYLAARAQKLVSKTRSLDITPPRRRTVHGALGWIFDREEALVDPRLPGTSLWASFSITL